MNTITDPSVKLPEVSRFAPSCIVDRLEQSDRSLAIDLESLGRSLEKEVVETCTPLEKYLVQSHQCLSLSSTLIQHHTCTLLDGAHIELDITNKANVSPTNSSTTEATPLEEYLMQSNQSLSLSSTLIQNTLLPSLQSNPHMEQENVTTPLERYLIQSHQSLSLSSTL